MPTTQQDLGSDSGDEELIIEVGMQGTLSLHDNENYESHASTSSSNEPLVNEGKRIELFHIRVIMKHTKVETLFDPSSQANLISESLVKKLGLETKPHLKPYLLGWVCDKEKLHVTKHCTTRFVIASKLVDEVDLDVVPLDICSGIVLGSPYLHGKKAVFFRHEDKYHLMKDEVEYIVRAHCAKISASLVSACQMKTLINSNKGCMLMVVREKDVETFEAFECCDPTHKKELSKIVSNYDGLFQEPSGLPPKHEIQHEIHLE